jgi:LmbE family N-acetylglucosaminyl deacetylase
MGNKKTMSVAIIVAHPDDETLWAGGTMLNHPLWKCFVVCLCRASDTDRAPRFYQAMKVFGAKGVMGDLDDGPTQMHLPEKGVEEAILNLLPAQHFDLIITHNPTGEYTKHLRHEEISKAVIKLWHAKKIAADELWTFAYEDNHKKYYPKPITNATHCRILSKSAWQKKYNIITVTYGFRKNGWEARTTPKAEAFWQFHNSGDAQQWLKNGGILSEVHE